MLQARDAANGRYQILAELGRGGTADVFLALAQGSRGLSKLVVLKALKPMFADDESLRNLFLEEGRLGARLRHPHIVQTYEVDEWNGVPVLVMEYLEGQPLSTIFALGRNGGRGFSLATSVRVIANVLRGLHYAHEFRDFNGQLLELVHRDMTPHNVFVTYHGETKILDFGIAKIATSQDTEQGIIKGKPRYIPPEQITGERIDRRADIYAVGAMLWEAATGVQLWSGYSDLAIMQAALKGEITPPSAVVADVPKALERICMKALSSDRRDRHATAAELEAELREFLKESGPPVPDSAIGDELSKLFAQRRGDRQAMIDAQLRKLTGQSASHEAGPSSSPAEREPTRPLRRDQVSTTDEVSVKRRHRSMVVLALLLMAVVTGLLLGERLRSSEPVTSDTVAPPNSVERGPRARRIEIQISASPAQARLYLDGKLLPSNPFTWIAEADGSQHIVEAAAEGHGPESAAVLAENDGEVRLSLEPIPNAAVAQPPPPRARLPRAAAAAPLTLPPVKKPDCDPKYFIDDQGVKRFKVECMGTSPNGRPSPGEH